MKRLIAIVIIFLLSVSCAIAEDIDWASLSDEDIEAIIAAAHKELNDRHETTDETIVAYDQDGHKLTLSNMREGNYINYDLSVVFDAVYENNSDGSNELSINGSYVNGWDTGALSSPDTTPGHKQKMDIVIGLDDTDVASIDEIERIELVFGYMDEDYDFTEFEPVVIYQK